MKFLNIFLQSFILLSVKGQQPSPHTRQVEMALAGAPVPEHEDYLCQSYNVRELLGHKTNPHYILGFSNNGTVETAHHITVIRCREPLEAPGHNWPCTHHSTCHDMDKITYVWTPGAKDWTLPEGVSFVMNGDPDEHIVIQFHVQGTGKPLYLGVTMDVTEEPTEELAGMYFLLNTDFSLKPHLSDGMVNFNCRATNLPEPVTIFAARVHAHERGRMVSTSVARNNTKNDPAVHHLTAIDPRLPENFYPVETSPQILPNDVIFGECHYDTTEDEEDIEWGYMYDNEMCGIYLVYSMKTTYGPGFQDFFMCEGIEIPDFHAEDAVTSRQSSTITRTVEMALAGAPVPEHEDYLCQSYNVRELLGHKTNPHYILGFSNNGTVETAHHITVIRCREPLEAPGHNWPCTHHSTCHDMDKITYVWTPGAKDWTLPEGVSFVMNGDPDEHIVIQFHVQGTGKPLYLGVTMDVTEEPTEELAGMYFLLNTDFSLKPRLSDGMVNFNCRATNLPEPVTIFAARVHAHERGRMVSTSVARNNTNNDPAVHHLTAIDPRLPENFYPVETSPQILPNDVIFGECHYDTSKDEKDIEWGYMYDNEMCGIYLVYSMKTSYGPGFQDFFMCEGIEIPDFRAEDAVRSRRRADTLIQGMVMEGEVVTSQHQSSYKHLKICLLLAFVCLLVGKAVQLKAKKKYEL